MTMPNRPGRILVYAALLGGAAAIFLPLAWMLSTALKPIEQTMVAPPTWVPYQYEAPVDGEAIPVRRGRLIEEPSLVVRVPPDGQRRIVPADAVRDGRLTAATALPGEIGAAVAIDQRLEASPETPWVQVLPEAGDAAGWHVVPASSVTRRVAPRWGNFGKAIAAMKFFPRYLRNTVVLCVLTVVGTVCSGALAAYGFARIPWRGRDRVFLLVLATMMIPFPVVMVPLYSLFRWLGWIGTLTPLWIGSFFASAFNVFLLRQFFLTIPNDLSDAARIDGCSEWRIFWQIILPLSKPALLVVALFQFMYTWNDYLGPLIFLTDQQDFTLALGLQFYQSQQGGTEWHYLMAASTLIVLPVVILFFFTQKTFIEGISMTGLKG
jgi:multiple sugar transport system permease protein